jgi:hypothetical protein
LFPETPLFVRAQYARTPSLLSILINFSLVFFGFLLDGNFLFGGQRRHGGIGDEAVARTPTPSLSARPNKPPRKFSAGNTSCICVFDVGSKLKAESFATWALISALRRIHLAKYDSLNTSRQLSLDNYVSRITSRQVRLGGNVAQLRLRPYASELFSRYCASAFASSPSHLRNLLSPKIFSTITPR